MAQVEQGYERPTLDPLRGLAYVALQEVATRAAHRNAGRYSDDPVADRIMARIQDRARLKPILAGSIAFTRKVDEAAACMYALQHEVLADQDIPVQGVGRQPYRS